MTERGALTKLFAIFVVGAMVAAVTSAVIQARKDIQKPFADWRPRSTASALLGLRVAPNFEVDEEVVYARIDAFRDRRTKPRPLTTMTTWGEPIRDNEIAVFDRAHYLFTFRTVKPRSELHLVSSSSGITTIEPLIGDIELNDGDHTPTPSKVHYSLTTDATGVGATVHNYWNGYQAIPDSTGYESDGGVHIYQKTRSLSLTFDFSRVQSMLVGPPTCILEAGGRPTSRKVLYTNGIARVEPLHWLMPGDKVHVYWTWLTESDPTPSRADSIRIAGAAIAAVRPPLPNPREHFAP